MMNLQTVSSAITKLLSLRVSLCVAGDFNGDLYGFLRHVQGGVTNFCVLLNRVGCTASDPWGYADCGFNVLFDDAAPQGDIHTYETITNPPAGTLLTGVWQPDGRDVDPSLVLDTTPRTTCLSSFTNSDPSGDWTLFLADMSNGGTNMLVSWGLLFTGPAGPPITWPTPANIVYGTALGAGQLNATSSVPGIFTYNPPAGTVLNAGSQVLSVTFNPTDTNNYAPVTANVALVVLPKTLTISAANASKLYGQALNLGRAASTPSGRLGGGTVTRVALNLGTTAFTTSGLVNGDTVTAVTLTSPGAAATATVAGSPYAITPSAAVGTGLGNYSISYQPGSLSVNPAGLSITAGPRSKTYGRALNLGRTASTPSGRLDGGTVTRVALNLGTTAFTTSGLLNGDTVTAVTLTSPGAAATATVAGSPYAITPSAAVGTGLGNYNISYQPGSLSVNPAGLTITANARSKTYGQGLNLGTTAFTTSGLLNSDTVTAVMLTSPGAPALAVPGDYPIVPSAAVGTGLANYDISYQDGSLSVLPAKNTVAITHIATSTTVVFAGVPGANYIAQCAPTPAGPWTNLSNAVQAAANGFIQFTDTTSPVPPTRFYRMQCVSGPD